MAQLLQKIKLLLIICGFNWTIDKNQCVKHGFNIQHTERTHLLVRLQARPLHHSAPAHPEIIILHFIAYNNRFYIWHFRKMEYRRITLKKGRNGLFYSKIFIIILLSRFKVDKYYQLDFDIFTSDIILSSITFINDWKTAWLALNTCHQELPTFNLLCPP